MDMGMMMFGPAATVPAAGPATAATGGGMGGGMQLFSGLFSGMAAMQEAQAAAAAAEFEAKQLEQKAAEERAAAQRQAIHRRKEVERVISRQVALGAASGAGVTTPSLLDIIGDTQQEGEYQALGDMFVGESRARGALDQAAAARYRARIAKMKGTNAFLGSMIGGLGSAYRTSSRYG